MRKVEHPTHPKSNGRWLIFEIALMIAVEWLSWRVWLCIGVAVAVIAVAYNRFPEQDGLWAVSYPLAILIVAFGFWWQWRADRT
jgi:hypothetical protein